VAAAGGVVVETTCEIGFPIPIESRAARDWPAGLPVERLLGSNPSNVNALARVNTIVLREENRPSRENFILLRNVIGQFSRIDEKRLDRSLRA